MCLVSVILPARNEKYLQTTLDSIYANADADIEVIVVQDGYTDYPISNSYPNLLTIKHSEPLGIRLAINNAVAASSGDYILKLDAHCIIGSNFCSTLLKDIQDDWVVVTSRYTLDLETLTPQPRRVDYFYLSCPWTYPRGFMMMQSCPWISRTEERHDTPIDDLMCFQGSMWFMSKSHWHYLDTNMQFAEHHEISFNTWYSGGRVVINKNAWYAHPKDRASGYRMDMGQVYKDHEKSAIKYATDYRFAWLIDKFWPLPTLRNRHRIEKYYWEEDWRGKYYVIEK